MRPISRRAGARPFLARVGAEALEDQRGADHAGADGGRQAQHVVPMGLDQLVVGPPGDKRRQRRPGVYRPESIQPALGQVGDARRETETEQVRQREHVVADTAPVRVVHGDVEVGLVVEQPVEDPSIQPLDQ